MAKAAPNVVLSPARDVPFDKLMLSQTNVRHSKSVVSVKQRKEDIARRGLLKYLNVRAVVDAEDSTALEQPMALTAKLTRAVFRTA